MDIAQLHNCLQEQQPYLSSSNALHSDVKLAKDLTQTRQLLSNAVRAEALGFDEAALMHVRLAPDLCILVALCMLLIGLPWHEAWHFTGLVCKMLETAANQNILDDYCWAIFSNEEQFGADAGSCTRQRDTFTGLESTRGSNASLEAGAHCIKLGLSGL